MGYFRGFRESAQRHISIRVLVAGSLGAGEPVSLWRGTRLCDPLFADGSGDPATPWNRRRGERGQTGGMNPCPKNQKQLKQPKTLANGHGQPLRYRSSLSCKKVRELDREGAKRGQDTRLIVGHELIGDMPSQIRDD